MLLLVPPKNLAGVALTGGSRKLRTSHRSIQLGIALLLFKQINIMRQAIQDSDDPEILKIKKKLLGEGKKKLLSLANIYQNRPEFTNLPEVKKILAAKKYAMKKNKADREQYSMDASFREYQKQKMREWRKRKGNSERENQAARQRRAKTAKWKKFCDRLK